MDTSEQFSSNSGSKSTDSNYVPNPEAEVCFLITLLSFFFELMIIFSFHSISRCENKSMVMKSHQCLPY